MSRDIEPPLRERDEPRDRLPDDPRDARTRDPHDVLVRAVALPRGPAREPVHLYSRTYDLRDAQTRMLVTIGAFRVVPANALHDAHGRPAQTREGDLGHLRTQGLVRTIAPKAGDQHGSLVTLTDRGHRLLEAHRVPDARQAFFAGPGSTRELTHDATLYRAYLRTVHDLTRHGARIERVLLEAELKRDYQRWLQQGNVGRADADGRPTQDREAVQTWAREHDLPYIDERVRFPDFRIEYMRPDGRRDREDVEVTTAHYRGAHAAVKAAAGFHAVRAQSMRMGGEGKGRSRPFDPRVAEEWLR